MTTVLKLWKLVQPQPINTTWLRDVSIHIGLNSFSTVIYVCFGIGFGSQLWRWSSTEAAHGLGMLLPALVLFQVLMAFVLYPPGVAGQDGIEEIAERINDLDDEDAAKVNAYIDYLLEHCD